MKPIYKIFFLINLVLCMYKTQAQDVHFSQNYLSPLNVNPALVGQFNGCFRFNMNNRNQWGSLMGSSAFKTTAFSADAQILKEQLGGNFIGMGVNFYSDKAGDLSYGTQVIGFNIGYCQILNKKKPLTIAAGLHISDWSKKLDLSKVSLDDLNDMPNLTANVSFVDFGTGLFLYHQPLKWLNYNVGFSILHLNSVNQTFVRLQDNLGKKKQFHGSAYMQVSDAFTLIPSFLYINQQGSKQTQTSLLAKVLIDENGDRETAIYFGLGTRFAKPSVDAATLYFRLDFYHFALGMSYDFNVSQLHYESKSFGGPEFALQYIIRCPKSKSLMYRGRGKKMFCPRF
jgi:type IX secretion system PorP/SprF family membrane protein